MLNPFNRLADRYRRWRHSRGYGVHSPFAYRLVTEALYPVGSYAYYLEHDARLNSSDPAESRRARALYRMINLMRRDYADKPAVYTAPDCPECWKIALRLAGARIVNKPEEASCSVTTPATSIRPRSGSGHLVLLGRHWTIIITGHLMADLLYTLP